MDDIAPFSLQYLNKLFFIVVKVPHRVKLLSRKKEGFFFLLTRGAHLRGGFFDQLLFNVTIKAN